LKPFNSRIEFHDLKAEDVKEYFSKIYDPLFSNEKAMPLKEEIKAKFLEVLVALGIPQMRWEINLFNWLRHGDLPAHKP
jgi:hypothetical protein